MTDLEEFLLSFNDIDYPAGTWMTFRMIEFFGEDKTKSLELYPYYSIQQVGIYKMLHRFVRSGKDKSESIRKFLLWQNREKLEVPKLYLRDKFGWEEETIPCHFTYSHDDDFTWNQCSEVYDEIKRLWDEQVKKNEELDKQRDERYKNEPEELPEAERFADPMEEALHKTWVISEGRLGKEWKGKFDGLG